MTDSITDNENAGYMQSSTVESYATDLRRTITGLNSFKETDGRAGDALAMLNIALTVLEGKRFRPSVNFDTYFEPSDEYTDELTEPIAGSGKDYEGNDLPPFSPMTLPDHF